MLHVIAARRKIGFFALFVWWQYNKDLWNALIILFFLGCSAISVAACPGVDDPDEFFDQLGAECVDYDATALSGMSARDNWGAGKVSYSIGTGDDIIRSVFIQSDGKLIATGKSMTANGPAFALVRFTVDGDLDLGFNTLGQVVITFGANDSIGHRVVVQSDGKSFVTGRATISGGYDFLAARFLSSGSLDTSFATRGYTQVNVGTSSDIARGLAMDTLGRYYLSGYSWSVTSGYYAASVARLNSDGSLDTSFATSGTRIFDLVGTSSGILATELDALGNVVFAGTAYSGNWQMVSGRLMSDGSLDTSFQTTGWVLLSIGTGHDQLYSLKLSNEKMLLAGAYSNGSNMDAAILRLSSNGTLDTSFSATGKVGVSFSTGDDYLYDLRLATDGAFVVAGYGTRTDQDFLTARYNSNGSLDTSYLTNGFSLNTISNTNDQIYSVGLTSSGHLYPAGKVVLSGSDSDMAVARISRAGSVAMSGSFDEAFGTAGSTFTDLVAGYDFDSSHALAFGQDGRITVLGGASNGSHIWARLMPNGALDTSFSDNGYDVSATPFAGISRCWVELQTDGRPVGGCMDSGGSPYLWRITTNGSYDTSYLTIGYKTWAASKQTRYGFLDPTGRALNIGHNGASQGATVTRFATNGDLDTSFGTSGAAEWASHDPIQMALTPDYQILISAWDLAGHPGIARLTSNGYLDTSFNTIGWRNFTFTGAAQVGGGVGIGADNKIYASSGQNNGAGTDLVVTWRLISNGGLDTTFNTVGYTELALSTNVGANGTFLQVQGNNKVIVDTQIVGYASYARYNTNGTLDTSFSTTGRISRAITGFVGSMFRLSNDGRLCGTANSTTGFTVVCFWP